MAQFEAALDQDFEQYRRDRLCAGTIAAAAINLFAEKPVSPMDFVPEGRHEKPAKPSPEMEADQIALMAAFLGAGPGQESNVSKVH